MAPTNTELQGEPTATTTNKKLRLATAWLGGCSGCHMSFLDLGELLVDLFAQADLVYSPIADVKEFPENVDITLVEGAVANVDHVKLAEEIRERSKVVVSFGDCAVTGNVTSLRNKLKVDDLLHRVYHEGPGATPHGDNIDVMPELIPRVIPLHQLIDVDAFIPGCPPEPDRIWATVTALIAGETPDLPPEMRKFG